MSTLRAQQLARRRVVLRARSRALRAQTGRYAQALQPVLGWTNHHSIVEFGGKWYIFYHDSQRSNGVSHLRNVKGPIELKYNDDGTIQAVDPYFGDNVPAAAAAN